MRSKSALVEIILTALGGSIVGVILVLFFTFDMLSLIHVAPSSTSTRHMFTIKEHMPILPIEKEKKNTQPSQTSFLPYIPNAQPSQKDTSPKISILLVELGFEEKRIFQNIHELPKEISFAFAPYIKGLHHWISKAHSLGHEILLTLSLESTDLSPKEAGPYTLLTNIPVEENIKKVRKILSKSIDIIGVVNFMGTQFLESRASLYPILEFFKDNGYLFVDDKTITHSLVRNIEKYIKGPFLISDKTISEESTESSIKKNLLELEENAVKEGSTLGILYATPIIVSLLKEWIQTLPEKGITLIPITELLKIRTP